MVQSKACARTLFGFFLVAGVAVVLMSGTVPGVAAAPGPKVVLMDADVGPQPSVQIGLDRFTGDEQWQGPQPSVMFAWAGPGDGQDEEPEMSVSMTPSDARSRGERLCEDGRVTVKRCPLSSWGVADANAAQPSASGAPVAAAHTEVGAREQLLDVVAWGAGIGVMALLSLLVWRLVGAWAVFRTILPAGWRLDRARVHAHPTRRAILDHLEKHPGATAQELAETAGVRNRRAVYHLSILKREDCVSVRTVEGRKHYFVRMAPKADSRRLRLRSFVRASRPGGQVLVLLARDPGATVSQVARSMGFAPGHAHYHLTKLAKEGLVDRLRRGRRVRHYLTTLGHDLVAEELQAEHGVSPGLAGSTKSSDPAAAPV